MVPLNTSLHRWGYQFIAVNTKLGSWRSAEIFFEDMSKRNMPGTHCYVRQFINRGNGHVINDHLRAKNSCVSRTPDTFCITSLPKHELLKSKLNLLFLPDTLAVRLLSSSFPFNFCKLQLGKNKHVTEGHLTIFCNTFTNFSQSISNNNYFSLWYTGPTISYL